MEEDNKTRPGFHRLRKLAEERLSGAEGADAPETEDTAGLLHELRTHRIELELQNEDLRHSQRELMESQRGYLELYDFAPAGYVTIGVKGLIEKANLTLAGMLGTERGRLAESPFSAFILPEDQDVYYRFRRKLLGAGDRKSCELRLMKKGGATFYARMEGAVVPEVDGDRGVFRAVITDITGRKRAEYEKERYEEAIRFLVTGGSGLSGQAFFDNMVRYLGKLLDGACTYIAELETPETARTVSIWRKDRVVENLSYDLAGTPCGNVVGKQICCYTSGVSDKFPDDEFLREIRAESYVGVPLFDSRGRAAGLITTIAEKPLTEKSFCINVLKAFGSRASSELERVEMERILRDSERQFREFIEGTEDLVVRVDPGGRIQYVNRVAERVYGTACELCIGRSFFDFIPQEDREGDRDAFLSWAREKIRGTTYENRQVNRKDGSIRYMLWTVSLTYDGMGNLTGVNGIARDLTARKEMEEEIRRMNLALEERVEERGIRLMEVGEALKRSADLVAETQKKLILAERMAALGEMVAGSTHEINTPLGIGISTLSHMAGRTRGVAELYGTGKMARSDLEKYLTLMDSSIEIVFSNLKRSAELVRSLKVVAVDQCMDDRRRFRLGAYLEEIMTSLGPALAKTSHLVKIECPELLELDSYPGAVAQIVTNLVMNSLKHGFENMEKGEIRIHVTEEKDLVHIRFGDNGKGIEEGHRERIFDEYFTTRRVDGGSGLGTSIVYNLVKQRLGGEIRCASTPGSGTTFTITIPREPADP